MSHPGAHRRQTTTTPSEPMEKTTEQNRDIWGLPRDSWAGADDHRVEPDPEYPTILHWLEENIPAIFKDWDQPVRHECPATFELPDAPREQNLVPSYWVQMAEELPWAHTAPPDLVARLESQLQNPHGSPPGLTRTATPAPTATLDPPEEEEDYRTPKLSLIPLPTQSPTNQLTIPLIPEEMTMSSPSSLTSTGKYLAPTGLPPGSYDNKTPRPALSGLTMRNQSPHGLLPHPLQWRPLRGPLNQHPTGCADTCQPNALAISPMPRKSSHENLPPHLLRTAYTGEPLSLYQTRHPDNLSLCDELRNTTSDREQADCWEEPRRTNRWQKDQGGTRSRLQKKGIDK
ncbi:hypothetical protein ARMGADRAFT_1039787 [Armillaria gallica]|uniref:Uncharacterized protein n=1 Tax=Armillaria gallica TaxID=47427 RepID=A0A2H3D027_ARMGA|nr:hypothetical protein ARMGADRAFT_1039787 [Armillaria gallica]